MRISTKGRYGTRFLLDLALHGDNRLVTLNDIARRQGISRKYLWHVVAPLGAAGLVSATPGSRGGYALARPPQELTVKDILEALEGDCLPAGGSQDVVCADEDVSRVTQEVWRRLGSALSDAMASITLQDMVARYREVQARAASTYDI